MLINYKDSYITNGKNLMDIIFDFDGYVDKMRDKSLIEPNFKVKENNENYYLYLNIPGIKKTDISLNVDNNKLIIKTTRKKDNQTFTYYGTTLDNYYKEFNIPKNIKIENIMANSKNGILTIIIPKKEQIKKIAKKIMIN